VRQRREFGKLKTAGARAAEIVVVLAGTSCILNRTQDRQTLLILQK
jgi:hypothetical protein